MNIVPRLFLPVFLLFTLALAITLAACRASEEVEKEIILSISHPLEGAFVDQNRVRVRGSAVGASRLEVNGVSTDVTGGQWEVLVEFGEGPALARATVGDVSVERSFFVDTAAPQIELKSPLRALVLDAAEHPALIRVEGQVTDEGSGVLYVKVGAEIVDLDEEGYFSVDYDLVEGLNEIAVTAIDRAENEKTTRRGIIYGPLAEPTDTIEQAFRAQILPPALDTLGKVIASFVTPEAVMGFIDEGLERDSFTIETIDFDPITVNLRPRQGHLELTLVIENLKAGGSFTISGDPIEADVAIARLGIALKIELTRTASGGLQIAVIDTELELEGSDITSNLIEDSQFLRHVIVTLAEYAFAEYVEGFLIEELYDPDMLKRRIELLGRSFEFELSIAEITIRETAILLVLNAKMPAEAYEDVPDVAGALNRALGGASASNVVAPVKVIAPRTALDRMAHGVWRSGLMHQALIGDDFAGVTLPFPLTVDTFATLIDGRISNYAAGDTPAALRTRPLLPPVIAFKPAENSSGVLMNLGELMLDFVIVHPDKAEETIVTAALFFDIGVELSFEGSEILLDFDVVSRAEVSNKPLFDIQDEAVIVLLEELIHLVPEIVTTNLVISGDADLPWLRFESPEVSIHGAQGDMVTVGVDLKPLP